VLSLALPVHKETKVITEDDVAGKSELYKVLKSNDLPDQTSASLFGKTDATGPTRKIEAQITRRSW